MTVLITLTLIWVTVLVLALVVYLTGTAVHLHRARGHLAGVADDLEKIAQQCEPLTDKVTNVGSGVSDLALELTRVDDALGSVLSALGAQVS